MVELLLPVTTPAASGDWTVQWLLEHAEPPPSAEGHQCGCGHAHEPGHEHAHGPHVEEEHVRAWRCTPCLLAYFPTLCWNHEVCCSAGGQHAVICHGRFLRQMALHPHDVCKHVPKPELCGRSTCQRQRTRTLRPHRLPSAMATRRSWPPGFLPLSKPTRARCGMIQAAMRSGPTAARLCCAQAITGPRSRTHALRAHWHRASPRHG